MDPMVNHIEKLENEIAKNEAEKSRKLFAVRWWDGYCETFEVSEVRMGAYLLWMKLTSGEERRIPLLSNVRWAGFVNSEIKL